MRIRRLGILLLPLLGASLLWSDAPGRTEPEKRVITVTLAMEAECLTGKDKSVDFFKNLVHRSLSSFEGEFALRFHLEKIVKWNCPVQDLDIDKTVPALFAHLNKTISKGPSEILIGITCRKNLEGEDGISFYQEGSVLIRFTGDPGFFRRVLIHEMAHLFGATHVDDSDSLMDRFLRGDHIKPPNREIIVLHHDRDFKGTRFPLDQSKLERVVTLYRQIARTNAKLLSSGLEPVKRKQLGTWLLSRSPSGLQLRAVQEGYKRLEDVYLGLALLSIEMIQYREAIAACHKALRINPQAYEAHNLMGIALRRSGEVDDAIQCYHNALEIKPSYRKIYYNLGIALMKKGEPDQAAAAYEKAIAANRYFADPWNNLGYIYLEKGELEKAIRCFRNAIEANPYHPLAHSNLAEALLRRGEVEAALSMVNRALTLNKNLPGPHNIRANIHDRQGEPGQAEIEYKAAASLDPSYYKAYYNLGYLYIKEKKYLKARQCFERVITLNPGFPPAYMGLGDTYLLSHCFEQAEQAFQQAARKGYCQENLYLNLSYIKIRQGDYAGALIPARKALELDPHLAKGHYNLGIIYAMTGRSREAEQAFVKALEVDPRLAAAWSGLGDLYFRDQQLEKASQAYLKSLALDPGGAGVHNNLAVIYYYKKLYTQAFRHMAEAEKLGFPVNPGFKKELQEKLTKTDFQQK
jgi:tetratricopeptide (TPR) repeat protein